MSFQEEKYAPKVAFKNEPLLSAHEADRKYNERRVALVPHIKDFISSHDLFKDAEVAVTFSHNGVSSLVCILETPNEKYILKIPLSINPSGGEGQFLKAWENAGASVPHVIEEGRIDTHGYILMAYVDASTLSTLHTIEELIEKETYIEMGQMLHTMHEPKIQGYGRSIEGKPEYTEFKDWFDSEDMKERFTYAQEHNLLSDEHGSLSRAREILFSHISKDMMSSYCHDDFGPYNIFATKPLTVFDPEPRFNNGYMDLGRSIVVAIANSGSDQAAKQLIKGYFGEKPFDAKVLHASILVNTYFKFPYWDKTKRAKHIQNIQEYLIQNKNLLAD